MSNQDAEIRRPNELIIPEKFILSSLQWLLLVNIAETNITASRTHHTSTAGGSAKSDIVVLFSNKAPVSSLSDAWCNSKTPLASWKKVSLPV